MTIAIIDYRAGNLASVQRALSKLGHDSVISHDPAVIARANRVVFPGVGAAASCMANLRAMGMDQALREAVAAGTPVLGICVGMQLLFARSDEDDGVDCLGLLPGRVVRFTPNDPGLKVPHMGWNRVITDADDPLFTGIPPSSAFYFVHSFFCCPADASQVMARAAHGVEFCAGIRRDNLVAVQFHPEKSGPVGLRFLQNFIAG